MIDPPRKCRTAVLTAPQRGAIGTLVVWGPQARELVARHCGASGQTSELPATGEMGFRRWRLGDELHEEVVVHARSETELEIHCHGGIAICERIVTLLSASGAEHVPWHEWARQHARPIQVEARERLAVAKTELIALILLDQAEGALDSALDELDAALTLREWEVAESILTRLRGSWRYGAKLSQPWTIALGGPVNAGKSTLMNRCLGFERAIASPMPGTTRDVLRGVTVLNGWDVEFIDAAGWRDAAEGLEREGIALGIQAWREADLRVLVVDGSQPPSSDQLARMLTSSSMEGPARATLEMEQPLPPPDLLVRNKSDLVPVQRDDAEAIDVSALTGDGCERLFEVLIERLVPEPPVRGAPFLFTSRQFAALVRIESAVQARDQGMARRCLLAMQGEEVADHAG